MKKNDFDWKTVLLKCIKIGGKLLYNTYITLSIIVLVIKLTM